MKFGFKNKQGYFLSWKIFSQKKSIVAFAPLTDSWLFVLLEDSDKYGTAASGGGRIFFGDSPIVWVESSFIAVKSTSFSTLSTSLGYGNFGYQVSKRGIQN